VPGEMGQLNSTMKRRIRGQSRGDLQNLDALHLGCETVPQGPRPPGWLHEPLRAKMTVNLDPDNAVGAHGDMRALEPVQPSPDSPSSARQGKPKLRGIPHLVGAVLSIPAGLLLVASAQSGIPRICAVVYATAIFSMLALSSAYHTPMWPKATRAKWQLVDHAMIFIQVGASYTPICLLALPEDLGIPLLTVAWALSLLGFFGTILSGGTQRRIRTALYWICGWVVLPVLPQVFEGMDAFSFSWLMGGGAVFCAGSFIYVFKKPNLIPGVFGYHEVFHCLVVAGFACHYVMVWHLTTG
jgi:hemolysin III